jgi:hypothetical protein
MSKDSKYGRDLLYHAGRVLRTCGRKDGALSPVSKEHLIFSSIEKSNDKLVSKTFIVCQLSY